MNVLIISDNRFLIESVHALLIEGLYYGKDRFDFACSKGNETLLHDSSLSVPIKSIDIKNEYTGLITKYDLIFSLHCKQLFPAELVKKVRCINVHPGFNPYNRGWYPQVFSILNGLKAGATIHEIDDQLDHGAIIAQQEVVIEKWDTSFTAYRQVQEAEVELLKKNLVNILTNSYKTILPSEEGNVNLKKDFNELCKIDLQKKVTMEGAIDYLRAMTHGEYNNAYFIDKDTGSKVFVAIQLVRSK